MVSPAGRAGWLLASPRGYHASWLPGDAIAGMTLAAIAIPSRAVKSHTPRAARQNLIHNQIMY